MDSEELSIGQIKSLRLVHFYHIVKDDESIPAVMVYYDRDKVVNLCMLDKNYDRLVEKIWEIYEAEKDTNWIILDDYSKNILDSAMAKEDVAYDRITEGYMPIDEPLCHHKGYAKTAVIPVVKYVIEQLYGMTEQKVLWNRMFRDWFGQGDLSATVGDRRMVFPYRMQCLEAGTYQVDTGNVLKDNDKLSIGICFKKNGIAISLKSSLVKGFINYNLIDTRLICIADITLEGKRVCNISDVINESSSAVSDSVANITRVIAQGNGSRHIWKLPWGQELVLQYSASENGVGSVKDGTVSFVTITEEHNLVFSLSYRDIDIKNQVNYTIFNYALDIYENKVAKGYSQMHFYDMGYGSRGYYKSRLAGKYYKAEERVME